MRRHFDVKCLKCGTRQHHAIEIVCRDMKDFRLDPFETDLIPCFKCGLVHRVKLTGEFTFELSKLDENWETMYAEDSNEF